MKRPLLALLSIMVVWSIVPAQCPAEIIFTARPAITGAVRGIPILVELRWENRGTKAETIDLGKDQRGGIVLIGSDGAAHSNECLPYGGLMLIPSQRIAPGNAYTTVILLDEWGTPVEGRHTLAFRMSKHPSLAAKMELNVKASSPEATKAELLQILRAASKSPEVWPKRAYLEAAGIFSESSEEAKELMIACCKAAGFEKMPTEIEEAMREKRCHLHAID